MKIITWNCNLKFKQKFELISSYDPDICFVQECENLNSDFFPGYKYFWTGRNENKGLETADVIVMGLNPGEAKTDWDYGTNLPTEESSEFDFHDEFGKGRSSVRWSKLCKDYLPNSNIFLSEFFFWSSLNLDSGFKRMLLIEWE